MKSICPFAVKRFFRTPARFWLRLISLLVICTGLATFAATAQTLEVTAATKVSEYWRGACDLLVRPMGAQLPTERELGLVEGNYLATGSGGITRAQYEAIKSLCDVEIAAPVATVGYIKNSSGGFEFNLPFPQEPALYEFRYRADYGGGLIVEPAQGNFYIAVFPDLEGRFQVSGGPAGASVTWTGSQLLISAVSLPPVWTLLAGINPEPEAQLVGLDRALTSGTYLESGPLREGLDSFDRSRRLTVIPVITYPSLGVELGILLEVYQVQPDSALMAEIHQAQAERGIAVSEYLFPALAQAPRHPLAKKELPLGHLLRPLALQNFWINLISNPEQRGIPFVGTEVAPDVGESQSGLFQSIGNEILLQPGHFAYRLGKAPFKYDESPVLELQPQGNWAAVDTQIQARLPVTHPLLPADIDIPRDAPVYRPLEPVLSKGFKVDVRGVFDPAQLTLNNDPLAYVPLGIYEPPLAMLRYDEAGQLVSPRVLSPGLNPGGFIPGPPLALTTLEAAEFFRGERFIDAIRVRVAGISGYTPENVAKVERVAREIVERTGLHVDIVAGSSPRKVLVHVPGLGYVEERWTTLGTAARITSGINVANLTLLGCLLAASVLYIGNMAHLSILARRSEIGLLKAVGWRTRTVLGHLLAEALLLGLLAAPLAALTSLALVRSLGLDPSWGAVSGVSLAAPVLYILTALGPTWRVARQPPIQMLRQGEVTPVVRGRRLPLELDFAGLALRQLWQRRARSLLAILTVVLGTGLAVVLTAVMVELRGTLRVTLLGEFVALSIRSYHLIMGMTALTMAALTVVETLLAGVVEREQEFGLLRAVGWHTGHVLLAAVWEGVIIGVLGGLGGGVVGALLFWALTGSLPPQTWTVAAAGSAGSVLLGALAALYPARQAARFTPAVSLAGLESRRPVSPMRRPALTWGVALGVVVTLLVGLALGGGRPEALREAMGIGGTSQPTLHPAERVVSGQRALEHAQALATLGPRALGNEAQAQAADTIAQALAAYGLQVEREAFPLRAVTFHDPDGSPLLTVPGAGTGSVRGVTARFEDVETRGTISGPVFLVAPEAPWPSAEQLEGKIVVVEPRTFNEEADPNRPLRDLVAHYGFPAPFLGAVSIWPDDHLAFEALLQREGVTVSIPAGQNIVATLPGQEWPEREIWVVAHYDTHPESPGADTGASGVGVLLELARTLSRSGSPVTVRFLALAGTETGLEGSIAYCLAHRPKPERVLAVLNFDRVGAWNRLTIGHDLAAPGPEGTTLEPQALKEARRRGQDFLRSNWVRTLDLGDPQLLAHIEQRLAEPTGLSETPSWLLEEALTVSKGLGYGVETRRYPCAGDYQAFLYWGLPSLVVCGEGNELAGSIYDTGETLRAPALEQAAALGYQLILDLGREER